MLEGKNSNCRSECFTCAFSELVGGILSFEQIQAKLCQLGLSGDASQYAVGELVDVAANRFTSSLSQTAGLLDAEMVKAEWESLGCNSVTIAIGPFMKKMMLIIAIKPEKETISFEKVHAVFEEFIRRIRFSTGHQLQCRISGFTAHPSELGSEYSRLSEMDSYLTLMEKTGLVFTYDELTVANPWGKTETHGVEGRYMRLLNALSVNDFDLAQNVLNEILDTDFFDVTWTIQMTYVLKYSVLNLIRLTMEHMKMVVGPEFFESSSQNMWGIVYKDTLSEIKEELNLIFEKFSRYITEIKNGSGPVWNNTLKEFINDQLADPDLSVASLAYRMGLNPAYMGRIFKKYNGVSLMDYIHQRRIDEAMHLMESGMKLGNIARAVGYDSPERFCQVFKRYVGKTPSAVRAQMAISGNTTKNKENADKAE